MPQDAAAGPGHDHGEEAASAGGNSPKRQPDGSVFLPKPSQRQLGVRTVVAEEKALPKTVELTGRVVADANAGGKVQPTQAGRIEPGPRGLPQLGQAVRKGETLAVVLQKTGRARLLELSPTGATLGPDLLVSDVRTLYECGLFGLAFHPHFAQNGLLYTNDIPMHPEHHELLVRDVKRVEAGMAPFGHGRLYRNFVEEQSSAASFHEQERLERLRAVRRRFDPATRLRANHPIDRELAEL